MAAVVEKESRKIYGSDGGVIEGRLAEIMGTGMKEERG